MDIETGFRGYHPYIIFLYYVCVLGFVLLTNDPLLLLVACFILITVNITHDRGEALKKAIPFLVMMAVLIIILNAFFVSTGTTILLGLWGRKITLEALVYGIVMALSLIVVFLLFVSFNLILNGNKFLYIFSRFLPQTAFLILLSMRFVPLLLDRLGEIKDVQRVKGLSLTVGTVKKRFNNGMILLQILLTWSLTEAIETADSMKSRGYGMGKRSSYKRYRLDKRDVLWGVLLVGLFLVCIVCVINGGGRMVIYPTLNDYTLSKYDICLLVSEMLIISFPILAEGGERLKWNYSH